MSAAIADVALVTSTAIEVREASAYEADTVHDLTQAAFGEYADEAAPSSALLETLTEVRDRMARGEFRAAFAEIGGQPVASVRFRADSRGLYFFRLSVHPSWRRRGAAQALLDWLEREAARRHAHRIWCQVRLIVPRNVALYEARGFAITERHDVMRHGVAVPTATMVKSLEAERESGAPGEVPVARGGTGW